MSDTPSPSRTYNAPEIHDLGTLAELTAASGTPEQVPDGAGYGPSGTPGS